MKEMKQINENEMVVEFLKAEINSPRFGKEILKTLKQDDKSKEIITNSNIGKSY